MLKNIISILATLLLFFAFPLLSFTQKNLESPVTWSFDLEELGEDKFTLIFKADIDKGWNVYSQFIEEGGPVATEILYENEEIIEKIGEALEEGHKKMGMDAIFEMHVTKFLSDQPYIIKQTVKAKDINKILKGYLTYMTCDEEHCLPPTDVDFTFDFRTGQGSLGEEINVSDLAATGGNNNRSNAPKIDRNISKPANELRYNNRKEKQFAMDVFIRFSWRTFRTSYTVRFPNDSFNS